jgi:hypothetical protein
MPIQKGQVLNPSGSDHGKRRLNKQLADKLVVHVPTAVKFVKDSIESNDPTRQEWATELIFNRVYGKPIEAVELSGPGGNAIAFMSDKPLSAEDFALLFAPKMEALPDVLVEPIPEPAETGTE